MEMVRVLIQLPQGVKSKLDGLRRQGTSISGFIRSIVERELNQPLAGKKGQ
jgi:metal-responsive CopG/Arc/MetJ family transcriptional regulator